MNKRVILIVLDSVGIGQMPDAANYGDFEADTLGKLYKNISGFRLPNMEKMGLSYIDGVDYIPKITHPTSSYAKMAEKSLGKDTTTGHWEMTGLISEKPFNVYPNGFDDEIMNEFKSITGYDFLCNKPYSGTEVIKDYGMDHIKTKKLIVYTSADSVFQIAAHEGIIPLNELYDICTKTRAMLNKYNIGRVIARPFIGDNPKNFVRTPNRKDFSLKPFAPTVLDKLNTHGIPVIGIGKISDIFANCGISESIHTSSNKEGIDEIIDMMKSTSNGLIFANLVDFDMLYGHRNDPIGYSDALKYFDLRLDEILSLCKEDDILIITADHGCDPHFTQSTDHTREYVPLLVYSKKAKSVNLGIRTSFCDVGASIAEYFDLEMQENGKSFLNEIM